ncbi:ubiquitin carboxyl-terminal hydrolase 37-like [Megalops cyprinoides]|uniref:ubiquitin carboxyl-terminal hydrolase 37-like n=1 Tax=Megalops cyprinoides TaxID=118141 RepID=UPI0018640608|nr:ubiquitin carboxyl-terminal hydrolase 37-like [Megalops cyprinoides]
MCPCLLFCNRLPNIGNSCYLNATLQCLFGLQQFVGELRRRDDCRPDLRGHLSKCFSDLHLARSGHMDEKVKLVRALKKTVSDNYRDFCGDEQQDAHEFLSVLLSQLKEESESLKRRLALGSYSCPVESNFDFRVQVVRTCCRCGAQVCGTEFYSNLSLDLVPQGNLQDSLKQYFKVTKVDCRCPKCPGQQATVQTRLLSLPRVLVLQLKRFTMTSSWTLQKLESKVAIPPELSLHPHCAPKVETPQEPVGTGSQSSGVETMSEEEQVELAIKLSMEASSPSSGHYVCDGHNGDSWLTFDDHVVQRSSQDSVLQLRERSAYLLFYVYR